MLFSAGGDVLDRRYELIAPIGVGAMAEVFRARDLLLDRDVAVKVFHRHLLRDPLTLARARSEMLVLARLGDAHLVRLYDASFPDPPGQPYLVMELVDGGTLTDAVGRAPMSTHRTAEVGTRLAQALAHVHAAGVVHRDVKPANVLLTPDGDVKLADFGIALADGSRVTATRTVVGTAGYLAPEQIRGADAGPCADVHALGLILLECLTARREYPGSDVQAAVARLHRAPVIPADLPRAWRRLLAELTADEPAARPTAAAAHRHLAELSGDWGLDVVPVAETRSAAVRARAVVAAAVVVVAGLGGLMTLGRTGDRPPAPVTVDSVAGAGAGAGLAGSGTSVTSRGGDAPGRGGPLRVRGRGCGAGPGHHRRSLAARGAGSAPGGETRQTWGTRRIRGACRTRGARRIRGTRRAGGPARCRAPRCALSPRCGRGPGAATGAGEG